MKKTRIIAGGAAIVFVIVASILWSLGSKPNEEHPQANEAKVPVSAYGTKEACKYLTQVIARAVLDGSAQKGTDTTINGDDVSVSTCSYTSVSSSKTATLLVHSPLSEEGVASNKEPFDPPKSGTQSVTGYGDLAFWDSQLGQLNVYKNGGWLIMTIGTAKSAAYTLDDAKKLADQILPIYY
jgi:hypothetical protein